MAATVRSSVNGAEIDITGIDYDDRNGDLLLRLRSSDAASNSIRRGALLYAAKKLRSELGESGEEAAVTLEKMADSKRRLTTADDRFDHSDVSNSNFGDDTEVIDMSIIFSDVTTPRKVTYGFSETLKKIHRTSYGKDHESSSNK